jgi:microcystin-dependent protein
MSSITFSSGVPMGTILPFILNVNNIPAGWLLCDGKPIPPEYSDLIRALGNNLTPNLSGSVLLGAGLAPKTGTIYELGTQGGQETHQLLGPEMPIHSHNCDNRYSGSNGDNDGYNVFLVGHATSNTSKVGSVNVIPSGFGNGVMWNEVGSTFCTDTTGNGVPHNNMQPYMAVNFIIYAGKNS